MISEDALPLTTDLGVNPRAGTPYFAEVAFFGRPQTPSPIIEIGRIVEVKGETKRGKNYFPHPFPARMPIEVAQAAVSALSQPGDVILDPMVGSGIVAKAALGLGRQAAGFDMDPLAIVQSRALCADISATRFEAISSKILNTAVQIKKSRTRIKLQWQDLDKEGKDFVNYWFETKHANELFALSLAIEDEVDSAEWPVFAALFSSLIISRASGASRAMDLSRSRPHRVDSKVPKSPFAMWPKQVVAFKRYYENAGLVSKANLKVGDARELMLKDESVDAIITSPPYLDAIDYIRTSKFSLIFLGGHLSKLRSIRSTSVGTQVGLATGILPASLDDMVEKRVSDPKRRPMVRRYLFDMSAALAESFRVLKPGGHALYVLGPSILSRRDYDAATVMGELARTVGFRPVAHGRRDISELRRSLPPPRRSEKSASINKRMTCEFYLLLTKDLE